jgi:transposase
VWLCNAQHVKNVGGRKTVWSASSQMIEAMIEGERDLNVLSQMAKSRVRVKFPQLEEASSGRFGTHHALVCRQIIDHVDLLEHSIATLTAEITTRLVPFDPAITILCTITGVSRITAEVMVAEIGTYMTRIHGRTSLRVGWCGPRQLRVSRQAPTNKHTPRIDLAAACTHRGGASGGENKRGSYFSAQYSRIAKRRGPTGRRPRWPTPSWPSPGTGSPRAPSMTIPMAGTSSSDTIPPSRRSGSSGGSRSLATGSP